MFVFFLCFCFVLCVFIVIEVSSGEADSEGISDEEEAWNENWMHGG